MELLYISCCQFSQSEGKTRALPAYGDKFWEKYLDVFNSVHVLGEQVKGYLDNGTLTEITNPNVSVDILPRNTNPKDFKNDRIIERKLRNEIKKAEAILIKPSSRKGMMAVRLAEEYGKPYMVELTGDLNLSLRVHRNILKRVYSPYIHRQILKTIKNAPFGLYVTEQYLQKVYPIAGKQCGASDVFINELLPAVLEKRLEKISALQCDKSLNIGLIGSYHDDRKGIDTAIEAIAQIDSKEINAHLNILALGVEEDRQKWRDFAQGKGVSEQLHFPPSCDTTEKVLEWIDTQDMIILPSRSEGLPRCIVEAMSRACPCITSDVCGMPELINHNWLHKPGDGGKLAVLIAQMAKDKQAMVAAAQENFSNAERFLRKNINAHRNSFLTEFKEYCLTKNG